jgi:hypothetical protein
MKRLLGVLLALGLTTPVVSQTVVCTETSQSPNTSFSATAVSIAAGLQCEGGDGGAVADSSLLTGLVSYWKLDEASGTRVDSVVASANDLTANGTGGVGSAVGKLGNGADFEASEGDYLINIANTTADSNVTFCGWFKPESVGAVSEFFSLGAGGNYRVLANTTFLQFGSQAFGQTFNFGSVVAGTWYHICAWYDADNNRVGASRNGVVSDAAALGANGAGTDIVLGARDTTPTSPTDGMLDEVGMWSRVLTQTEITCLYGSGTPPAYPFSGVCVPIAANTLMDGLTLYAKLDEASGDRETYGGYVFAPQGSPTAPAGILLQSVGLTGSDCGTGSCTAGDSLSTPSVAALQTGSSDFAASAWFYIPAASPAANRAIVGKSTEWFCRVSAADVPNCFTNHAPTVLWGSAVSRDEWHHLYFEVDADLASALLSVDGLNPATGALPTPPILSTTESVDIGTYFAGTGGYGIGRVDEVALWIGKTLTVAQRACLWHDGSPISFPFSGTC